MSIKRKHLCNLKNYALEFQFLSMSLKFWKKKEKGETSQMLITGINDPKITQYNIINRNNYKRVFTIFMISKRKRLPTMLLRSSWRTAQPKNDSFSRFTEHSTYFFKRWCRNADFHETKMFENVSSSTHAAWPRTSEHTEYKRIYLARACTPATRARVLLQEKEKYSSIFLHFKLKRIRNDARDMKKTSGVSSLVGTCKPWQR